MNEELSSPSPSEAPTPSEEYDDDDAYVSESLSASPEVDSRHETIVEIIDELSAAEKELYKCDFITLGLWKRFKHIIDDLTEIW